MREGKRSVGNEEKFNVEIDRKFILVLRTQDKKTTFYFSYPRANSTFNSSLIYKLIQPNDRCWYACPGRKGGRETLKEEWTRTEEKEVLKRSCGKKGAKRVNLRNYPRFQDRCEIQWFRPGCVHREGKRYPKIGSESCWKRAIVSAGNAIPQRHNGAKPGPHC